MQEPDIVLGVDREARGIAELPVRRHLRPRLVHFELGKIAGPRLRVDDELVSYPSRLRR